MTPIPFNREFEPDYGSLVAVTPLIRRLVARNSGPFTAWGTGTYVIGHGEVAVIDPGPLEDAHIDALLASLQNERITHLVITHTHLDHSPAAAIIRERSKAEVIGCGPHGARGETTEAGADYDYMPDRQLFEGDRLAGKGWTLTAVATPGHTSNHLCYCLEEEAALFTGDHVMGWSTTVVSPPDGDMAAYMASLESLLGRNDKLFYPTHGAPIAKPQDYVRQLIGHRREREAQVLDCVAGGCETIDAMVRKLYADVDVKLHRAAGRSVLAHLLKLIGEQRVVRIAGASGEADAERFIAA
jgi:glyoxylase-like metal-dependent hydrolase (beta-lactamase superfamily II)